MINSKAKVNFEPNVYGFFCQKSTLEVEVTTLGTQLLLDICLKLTLKSTLLDFKSGKTYLVTRLHLGGRTFIPSPTNVRTTII